ncbi:hypothetical protein BVV10_11880 [Xanthomonas oryzae pv. oryzae]|nr:hypothetical protein BVV16_11870 [Xanthomonas oryzae pv. oryzae]AUI94391.1 hypothetical protein BVV17_11875 [Xanthomonas oryzae pv. oryzae]AUI98061.1 hypothetical protein BVV18_11880 [Xanthomonas oryzae pv. oryzae]AUJ01736.1 hypothetical protein BVV10_11880 [Xanthomonas oryzae pv. oryzae]AUJ05413.1 hypothetical protein BVV19_11900 [Xanthomonas oryzae pv. oryzae]
MRWSGCSVSKQLTTSAAVSLAFQQTTRQLSGAVSLPIARPLAAWMPPSNPQGRVYGVSRERRGRRALDQPSFSLSERFRK